MILGFLKDIQKRRKAGADTAAKDKASQSIGSLKIVVMSATLDAKRFSEFYDE